MLLIVAFYQVWAQNPQTEMSDLEQWGIRGKVKSQINSTYHTSDVDTLNCKPIDTTKWFRKTIVYYDTFGNTLETQILKNTGQNIDTLKIKYNTLKNLNESYFIKGHDTLFTYKKKWIDSTSYSIESYNKDHKLFLKTTTNIRKSNQRTEKNEAFNNSNFEYLSTDYYEFNSDNYIFKKFRIDKSDLKYSEKYREKCYDDKGNSILTLRSQEQENTDFFIFREYKYYE